MFLQICSREGSIQHRTVIEGVVEIAMELQERDPLNCRPATDHVRYPDNIDHTRIRNAHAVDNEGLAAAAAGEIEEDPGAVLAIPGMGKDIGTCGRVELAITGDSQAQPAKQGDQSNPYRLSPVHLVRADGSLNPAPFAANPPTPSAARSVGLPMH